MDGYKAVSVRFPEVLKARADAEIKKRRETYPKYSFNDFMLDAMRHELDGPPGLPAAIQVAPAVQTGQEPTKQEIGIDAAEWLASRSNTITKVSGAVIDLGDAPAEDVKTKPWLPELIRLAKMGEMDPGSAAEEMNSLLKGDQFRAPKGWFQWSMEKRARWLDLNKPLIQEGEW